MPDLADQLEPLSFCGLHCGTCYLRNGHVAELATGLLSELKAMRFETWGPRLGEFNPKELGAFRHAQHALDVLAAWDNMRCERACREGGGSAECKIRKCCQTSRRAGCWECARAETCEILAELNPVNGRLHLTNIRCIKSVGVAAFLAEVAEQKGLTFYLDPE